MQKKSGGTTLTDGYGQIDREKRSLVISQSYFSGFSLALEQHHTLVIIPCQLVPNGLAF